MLRICMESYERQQVGPTTSISQSAEVAFIVFNRDVAEEKKGEGKMKKKAAFLGVALQTLGNLKMRRRPPWVNNPDPHCGTRQRRPAKLEPNQCAYCKQEGQWKRQ